MPAPQKIIDGIICRPCTICGYEDHHWYEDWDEDTDTYRLICKHCEAVKLITETMCLGCYQDETQCVCEELIV